jgi:hypothetical protein
VLLHAALRAEVDPARDAKSLTIVGRRMDLA